MEHKGIMGLVGSRDATREAFKNGLIERGEDWMKMIEARNKTSHTYNLEVAQEVVADILERYYPAFEDMTKRFTALSGREAGNS